MTDQPRHLSRRDIVLSGLVITAGLGAADALASGSDKDLILRRNPAGAQGAPPARTGQAVAPPRARGGSDFREGSHPTLPSERRPAGVRQGTAPGSGPAAPALQGTRVIPPNAPPPWCDPRDKSCP